MTIKVSVPNAANAQPGAVLPAGPPGADAYAVAVLAGFLGTREAWLSTLKGAPGEPGRPGAPGGLRSIAGIARPDISLADLALDRVDNTPDAAKPVSTPQARALDGKLDRAGGALIGGRIDGTPVGQDTPEVGAFTALSARRLDGPMTVLAETEPPVGVRADPGKPDTAWQTRASAVRTAPYDRASYGYIGDAVVLIDKGANRNGPATAGYGRSTTVVKDGFGVPFAAPRAGEIDGALYIVRQAGPVATSEATASDLDGLQVNVQQQGDCGYAAAAEFQSSRIDAGSFAMTHDITVQLGIIDPFGGNTEAGRTRYVGGVHRLTYGMTVLGRAADGSQLDRGVFIASAFRDALYVGTPGVPALRVRGADGAVVWGADGASYSAAAGDGVLQFRDADGATALALYPGGSAYLFSLATNGLSVVGQTIVDGNAHVRLRRYTRQTLPTPTADNQGFVQVTNPETGKTVIVGNLGAGDWQYLDGSAVSLT